MPMCAAYGCSNRKNLHKLPKSEALRKVWLEQLNRKNIQTKDIRVCSNHFHSDAYVPDDENIDKRGRKRATQTLKECAYPTLNLKPKEEEKENNRKRKLVNENEEVIPIEQIKKSKLEVHNYATTESKPSDNSTDNI